MKRYFLTGVAVCLGLLTYAQKAVDFKLNPEIGKPMTINMLMKTDIDGPQSVIMDMNMKMLMNATKKESNNFTIENVTKSVKVDIDAGMMTMSYNSEEEPVDEMAKMLGEQFSKIIGQTITMLISEKGKTLDIQIPENLAEGLDRASFSNLTTTLPEKPVAPGESWTSVVEVEENPILSKTEMVSTFREENADGYVIDVTGKLFDQTGESAGSITATYTLNKKTHFTKSGVVKTLIEVQGAKIQSDITLQVD